MGVSPETLEASRQMMGEYLIGQAIACMKRGMPPHPMIRRFAEDAGFRPVPDTANQRSERRR